MSEKIFDPSAHYFAWWNVENLFDVEDSPARPEWLQSRLRAELRGWTAEVLAKKISQLAWVIRQINDGRGPDLLGMCEVENDRVLWQLVEALDLPERDYGVVHHDMSDNRGIDVAFIYDKRRYKAGAFFSHLVQKRSPTRDILQVNFEMVDSGKTFVVLGNHWPSRLGGVHDSAPFRMMAGETLAYFHDRALHYLGADTPVIVMGDFNDGPGARSLVDFALSSNSRDRVVYARSPMLFNLMWPLVAAGRGTHVYGTEAACLDQVLVGENCLKSESWLKVQGGAELVVFDGMVEGRYGAPRRYGRPSGGLDLEGFSDHTPVSVWLTS